MSLFVILSLACALITLVGGIGLARNRAEAEISAAEAAATSPLGRLRAVVEAGQWNRARPPMLVLGGLLGLMVFGSLVLVFDFDQPRGGWPMFVLALCTIVWALRQYRQG